MKIQDLEKYRDKDGYINWNSIPKNIVDSLPKISEYRGTPNRDKIWYEFNDGEIMLRNENMSMKENHVEYTTYQELVSEEVAKLVGLPAAHYDLVKRGDKFGVYTRNVTKEDKGKDWSLISLAQMMDSLDTKNDYGHEYDIRDALRGINNFCKIEGIGQDEIEHVKASYIKSVIYDIYTCSTDSHPENVAFLKGIDRKTKDITIKLSPIFDNELSYGTELTTEQKESAMNDYYNAELYEESLIPCVTAPCVDMEEKKARLNQKEAKAKPIDNVLQYCMAYGEQIDPTGEVEEFLSNWDFDYNSTSLLQCIRKVEDRIKAKLPDKYIESVLTIDSNRQKRISKIIDKYNSIENIVITDPCNPEGDSDAPIPKSKEDNYII